MSSKRMKRRDLTTGNVADLCGVAPRTVTQWIDCGKLDGYRLPRGARGPKQEDEGDRRVTKENLVKFLKVNGMPMPAEFTGGPTLLVGFSPEAVARVQAVDPDAVGIVSLWMAAVYAGREQPRCVVIEAGLGTGELLAIPQGMIDTTAGWPHGCFFTAYVGEYATQAEIVRFLSAGYSEVFRTTANMIEYVDALVKSRS
ncbi:MAG: hypothetical protein ACRC7O_15375 [Fimbriiglobus sp.]